MCTFRIKVPQFRTLTRIHGVTFDSVAHFIRKIFEINQWKKVKIFNRHPRDPRFIDKKRLPGDDSEILPMFCYQAASALVREFRTHDYNYANYQMEVWLGQKEYEYTLVEQLGKEASGKERMSNSITNTFCSTNTFNGTNMFSRTKTKLQLSMFGSTKTQIRTCSAVHKYN